ncbi:MAG TPA: bifunctional homocysteine S-methyltransferase/methylenetetrahydrofolate reductase [Vicinamibacterales bacterium]|nr:bifunctional homocysteine S-methyltransferase/methylenetetrahydrofolate reductase [Vicinamibacterales bacterium]
MTPFLQALDDRVLVCDGAMGTMLYAQGIFINRCFDSLNLTDPDRVRSVHRDYVTAGADVLETNTFGANAIKLRAFGLEDRLADINIDGARLAREAAGESVYVAGAIGPLGLRIEPWGRTANEEAQAYFREQAAALVKGGVDLIVVETFRDLNEIGAAVSAVRSVCDLPIVAQMTIEDEGNTLDGTPPEQFVPALQESGADVIGINCSIGPAHMLETLERMAALTNVRLSAQPNAGRPRDIEGRTLYLTSPEYMASYARRFLAHRVRLVGGCCGTTPEHIARIKSSIDGTTIVRPRTPAVATPAPAPVTPIATNQKSFLASALARGRRVTLVEIPAPKGHIREDTIDQARSLRIRGVDLAFVSDRSSGPRVSAMSLAVLLQQRVGIETVLEFSTRDRTLLAMQSELLGAHALGIRNLVAVTGEVRPVGDYPDATTVADVDSIGLVNAVARLNRGQDVGGQAIGDPTAFHLGVTVNPGAEDLDHEIRRFEYKVAAGAEFIVTRPVFDPRVFERLFPRIETAKLPILLGLRPFESVLDAECVANEEPGTSVPAEVLDRMRSGGSAVQGSALGVRIAREIHDVLREHVQGVFVAAPLGRLDLALDVLV